MEKLPIDEIIMQLDSKDIKERNAAIQIVRLGGGGGGGLVQFRLYVFT